MVFVPVPNNSTSVVHPMVVRFTRYTTMWPNYQTVLASGVFSYTVHRKGIAYRNKGKAAMINGKKWRPVRGYTRSSSVATPISGDVIYPWASTRGYWCEAGLPTGWSATSGIESVSLVYNKVAVTMTLNTKAQLITECLVKAGRRSVNFGEMIGEMGRTINHLARTVITLCRVLLAFRRGKTYEALRLLKLTRRQITSGNAIANRWLEYIYGWLPLMNDIYDTVGFVKQGFASAKPMIMRSRRTITQDYRAAQMGGIYDSEMTGTARHSCLLYYMPNLAWLNRANQIGLINPLEVVWAIMPYSFVVDWLLPVGNFLEACSARMAIQYVDGCTSTRYEETGTSKFSAPGMVKGPSKLTWACSSYVREKVVGPYPSLYVKSPFSSTHVVTALALLRQLRRG